jgi:hypothetical protein
MHLEGFELSMFGRGSLLLWSLAAGTFIGFSVLVVGALTGSAPFVEANKIAHRGCYLSRSCAPHLLALKQYQERTIQTVRLVPMGAQSFYGVTKQLDDTVNTTIVIKMEVFNVSEKSIWLPDLKLLRPMRATWWLVGRQGAMNPAGRVRCNMRAK